MKNVIEKIKNMLNKKKPRYVYLVKLSEIIVPAYYKKTKVGKKKWKHKLNYWKETGEFESPIMLHRNFVLADGYSSVKIAYLHGVDIVPVYFID